MIVKTSRRFIESPTVKHRAGSGDVVFLFAEAEDGLLRRARPGARAPLAGGWHCPPPAGETVRVRPQDLARSPEGFPDHPASFRAQTSLLRREQVKREGWLQVADYQGETRTNVRSCGNI